MSGAIAMLELEPAPRAGDDLVDEILACLELASIAPAWRDRIIDQVRQAQAESMTWSELDAHARARALRMESAVSQ